MNYTQNQMESVIRVRSCKTYYEVLKVNENCTSADIKKSFRSLALLLHPDKNHAPGATKAFEEIGKALETLMDAKRRNKYDDKLRVCRIKQQLKEKEKSKRAYEELKHESDIEERWKMEREFQNQKLNGKVPVKFQKRNSFWNLWGLSLRTESKSNSGTENNNLGNVTDTTNSLTKPYRHKFLHRFFTFTLLAKYNKKPSKNYLSTNYDSISPKRFNCSCQLFTHRYSNNFELKDNNSNSLSLKGRDNKWINFQKLNCFLNSNSSTKGCNQNCSYFSCKDTITIDPSRRGLASMCESSQSFNFSKVYNTGSIYQRDIKRPTCCHNLIKRARNLSKTYKSLDLYKIYKKSLCRKSLLSNDTEINMSTSAGPYLSDEGSLTMSLPSDHYNDEEDNSFVPLAQGISAVIMIIVCVVPSYLTSEFLRKYFLE